VSLMEGTHLSTQNQVCFLRSEFDFLLTLAAALS
jgi:hypothetical protein